MTNEQAIRALHYVRESFALDVDSYEALNMAIEALNFVSEHHQSNIETYAHDMGVSLEQAERELRVEELSCSEEPNRSDTIYRQDAIDALDKRFDDVPMELTVEILQLRRDLRERIPSAQPEKSTTEEKSQLAEEKSTRKLIYLDEAIDVAKQHWYKPDIAKELEKLPSAEPEIIHCFDCIYYDPEHIEKNGVRYEYDDMPKVAFDILGTGLVNLEYGINVGGRCCRDYNVGYSEDKRVFVSGQNYCGRAERREDADQQAGCD